MGEDVTLPPGFRFHPTDEELVSYYLRRKISGKSFNLNAIAEVDLYKTEPWDLPGKSCLKNRDLEWYFFSPLDKKYGIGARTNRATEQGYWKVTGKDREVRRKSKKLGLKKTLVFYQGRAPLGERTNWVMHEYRLVDNELGEAGIQHVKNSFVLCRVFKRSGSGPKTSEHYGAPLIEEEWDESDAPKSGQLPLSMFSHPAPSSSESPKMQSSDHGEKQPVSYGIPPQDGLDPMDGDDNWPKEDDIASIAAAVAAAVACLVATSNNMNNDDPPPCNNYLTVRATGRLHDTIHCSVDEQVAMFMHIVAHNVKIRALKFYFRRSGETVSRYFNNVLHSIIGIEEDFMKTPEPETPKEILDNPKWWPYFKDCIGAIDGTHILVKVSCEHLPRFRGRKHLPTQNVMAACSFNLKFIYVLAGWEGSASDSRILASALTRENDIQCPPGKYYVVDTGYPLLKQFITPFRSVRYHLNDIRGRAPTTPKELFNQRHLSLRNAIERIFGVWKKRFKILVEEPMYPFKVQVKLVLACCIIHNFVRGVMPNDPLLEEVDREQGTQAAMLNDAVDSQLSRIDDAREGKRIREVIMNHMWTDFNSCHC